MRLNEEITTLKEELKEIRQQLLLKMITEGVDDPGILKCVFMAGGPGCFVEGTLVRTEGGYIPINEVREGTLVYTINETTLEEELKPVVLTHEYTVHTEDLLELEFEDGTIVRCTENHKFYVDGKWIAAKDLNSVKRKTNLGKCNVPVYDLTVLDNSNYQITDKNIIVHNSGKSYTAKEIFGVGKDLTQSFSASGLKIVNSDTAFEKGLKDNGINPKDLAKIEKEDPELWDTVTKGKDSIRGKAKKLTQTQQKFYEAGRLGMIIDGTGDDTAKIKRKMDYAKSLGYDCYMVFVNTSLEVALERNANRERTLSDDLVTQIWKDCQNNLGKFQQMFSGNFVIVDNTKYGPVNREIQKAIDRFVKAPTRNPIGKKWIETARMLKNRNLIK